ncbi:ATP-binding protein [Deinococcus yavapaiensis]|nr:LuxR C-terminal-related transcriptional regulator [Deinococcus yavapaiensis]
MPRAISPLPAQATSLVGRERELEQVHQILNWPDVTLLTLTGPGGVGKTRLALELAGRLQDRFPDGVVFVPLAALERPAQVLPAIAEAVNLHEAGRDLVEALGDVLAPRQLLLVLDNFEHVLAAAPDVSRLTAVAPGLTVLATSRERLKLYGEHEFPVSPLGLPSAEDPVGEAVRLFFERARAVRPDFTLTDAVRPAVEELCRRLDGLPLAIELAAARIRMWSVPALLARMDQRLTLLTEGPSDLPSRQRTLRAAIEWSHALLAEDEQRLFARLGVFVGDFTLEAAEAVGGGDVNVLSALTSLVDKSLVQSVHDPLESRFLLLESLRAFALERLDASADAHRVRAAHRAFYQARTRAIDATLRGDHSGGVAHGVARELPNILAALAFSTRTRDEAALADFAEHLPFVLTARFDESAAPYVREALNAAPAGSQAVGWWQHALAFTAFRQGDALRSEQLARKCVETFEAIGEARGLAYGLQARGYARFATDPLGARADLERCLEWARPQRDAFLVAVCLNGLGLLAGFMGATAEARAALQESAEWSRTAHHSLWGWAVLCLAPLDLAEGDVAAARAKLHDVLDLARRVDEPVLTMGGLYGAAAIAMLEGRERDAAFLWGATDAIRTALGIRPNVEREMFMPWLASLPDSSNAPRLADAVQAGQNASLDALLTTLTAANLRPDMLLASADSAPSEASAHTLTPRERDVLRLLAEGLSNKQIAAKLGSGVYTVNDQVAAVFSKLGVRNRAAATRYALQHGLA